MEPQQSILKIDSKKSTALGTQRGPAASSTVGVFISELRCVKRSARITSRTYETTPERLDFEKRYWQQTFDAMGGLKKLKLKESKPFTTLNKSPYHCGSLARDYSVRYGKMSHVQGASTKISGKEIKQASLCKCTEPILPCEERQFKGQLGTFQRLFNLTRKDPKLLLLNHGVRVWWDPRLYNREVICEWLQRAVSCSLANTGIRISWHDSRLYNYGYYRMFENDVLSKNASFANILTKKIKGATTSSMSKASTTAKLTTWAKSVIY